MRFTPYFCSFAAGSKGLEVIFHMGWNKDRKSNLRIRAFLPSSLVRSLRAGSESIEMNVTLKTCLLCRWDSRSLATSPCHIPR